MKRRTPPEKAEEYLYRLIVRDPVSRRWQIEEAWLAGYRAAMRDQRKKGRKR